ncbi:hypothetical protein LTR09_004158 [Extremus antarcticus]|uniref:Uncharacterized protein n=1 Tax=Extremus antarcticus TaxID=702011 RepID=A0AAJ0DQZ5_9PEZI|nr:hypothetical protein LTR09_004158 [Extremus antarcticus]
MAPSRGVTRMIKQYGQQTRTFTILSPLQSGHNRWSKIKHDKGKADALKNRQRSALAQEIATASKLFGHDPSMNPRLADLVVKAKKEGFAKASIEAAIARGQGKSTSGASLESVTVEGILPNNVAVIVECETESKLKTLADVRLAMKDVGGAATPCSYLFEKRGRVVFEQKDGVGPEEALDSALEAGATDVEEDEDRGVIVFCEPSDTNAVGEAMGKALNLVVKTNDIIWSPNAETQIALSDERQADDLGSFVDLLLDRETSVQAVSMNVAQGSTDEGAWKELQSRLSA